MKTLKKISNIVSIVTVCIAFVLIALTLVPMLFGFKNYAVLSPSMTPKYPVGSMVYVKSVPTDELKEKDVITFRGGANLPVTHRIERIVYEKDGTTVKGFVTKGDANDIEDGELPEDKVIGKVFFQIPVIGFILTYIKRPIVYIPLIFLLLVVVFLPDIVGLLKKILKTDVE